MRPIEALWVVAMSTALVMFIALFFYGGCIQHKGDNTAPTTLSDAAPVSVSLEKQIKILQQQIDQNNRRTMIHHFEITALNGIEDRITDVDKSVIDCHQRIDDIVRILKIQMPSRKPPPKRKP